MTTCGGKTRSGGKCQRPAGWGTDHPGEGRCKLHAGSSLRGADHPNFKHGIYSQYAPEAIQSKVGTFLDADPFNLTDELALTRALLADFLERSTKPEFDGASIGVMNDLITNIRKLVETISKIKNETALTAAEVTFIAVRLNHLLDVYIDDPVKREACKQELFRFTLPEDAGAGSAAGSLLPGFQSD